MLTTPLITFNGGFAAHLESEHHDLICEAMSGAGFALDGFALPDTLFFTEEHPDLDRVNKSRKLGEGFRWTKPLVVQRSVSGAVSWVRGVLAVRNAAAQRLVTHGATFAHLGGRDFVDSEDRVISSVHDFDPYEVVALGGERVFHEPERSYGLLAATGVLSVFDSSQVISQYIRLRANDNFSVTPEMISRILGNEPKPGFVTNLSVLLTYLERAWNVVRSFYTEANDLNYAELREDAFEVFVDKLIEVREEQGVSQMITQAGTIYAEWIGRHFKLQVY